jgi:hypothetical protein
MDFHAVSGIIGQALPGRFLVGSQMGSHGPADLAVIAALLSGRFAAEMPIPGCYHEEKAT